MTQLELLPTIGPAGFIYRSEFLSEAEQVQLLASIRPLPFKEFEFHQFVGRRRVVSYGWKCDFGRRQLDQVEDVPDFLSELRYRAAGFANLNPQNLQQAMVTEYPAGAGIGWHRDKSVYGEIVGISLGASCTFRLRRKVGAGWTRHSLLAEPGSAYLLSGPARDEWEHSIPPVGELRYSITFRNLRAAASPRTG